MTIFFIQLYAGYDENEIGALDCEEIEGYVAPDSEIMLQYADEFAKQQNEPVICHKISINSKIRESKPRKFSLISLTYLDGECCEAYERKIEANRDARLELG